MKCFCVKGFLKAPDGKFVRCLRCRGTCKVKKPKVVQKCYFVTAKCNVCKKTKGFVKTCEGKFTVCVRCGGTGEVKEYRPHPSHKMSNRRTEIIAPCGTPRFYSVRHCKVCSREEWQHAAGHFMHGLSKVCSGKNENWSHD